MSPIDPTRPYRPVLKSLPPPKTNPEPPPAKPVTEEEIYDSFADDPPYEPRALTIEPEGDGPAGPPLGLEVTIPQVPVVSRTDTEHTVTDADLILANMQLQAVGVLWKQVTSIGQACKLISATIEATKHRRALLQLPYGSPNKVGKTWDLSPLD